jgi:hypothetical protein
MDTLNISVVLNVVLAGGALILLMKLLRTAKRFRALANDSSYARGVDDGRKELLDSIRYEREVYECRRTGLVKKETSLKIRESVMLGNLRLAYSDHEVTLASEVNQENVWHLIDKTGQALVGPDLGSVVQRVAPSVRKLFASAN